MAGLKRIAKLHGGLTAKSGSTTVHYDGNGERVPHAREPFVPKPISNLAGFQKERLRAENDRGAKPSSRQAVI